MSVKKVFILYDERAKSGDTEDACVLVTADSETEARGWNRSFTGAWFEYDMVNGEAVNENRRVDLEEKQ